MNDDADDVAATQRAAQALADRQVSLGPEIQAALETHRSELYETSAAVGAAGDSAQESVASTREELNVILDRIAAQGAGDSALRDAERLLFIGRDYWSDDCDLPQIRRVIDQWMARGGTDPDTAEVAAARAALSVEERAACIANGGNAGASHVSAPSESPVEEAVREAQASADPKVWAQHDETGRLWIGLRSKLPPRYTEYHPTAAALPEAPAPARPVRDTWVAYAKWAHESGLGAPGMPTAFEAGWSAAQVGAVSAGPPREPDVPMIEAAIQEQAREDTPDAGAHDSVEADAARYRWLRKAIGARAGNELSLRPTETGVQWLLIAAPLFGIAVSSADSTLDHFIDEMRDG